MFNIFFITKRSLKLFTLQHRAHKILTNNKEEKEKVINFCRTNKLSYDMLPFTKGNLSRIGLLLNKVKSIS